MSPPTILTLSLLKMSDMWSPKAGCLPETFSLALRSSKPFQVQISTVTSPSPAIVSRSYFHQEPYPFLHEPLTSIKQLTEHLSPSRRLSWHTLRPGNFPIVRPRSPHSVFRHLHSRPRPPHRNDGALADSPRLPLAHLVFTWRQRKRRRPRLHSCISSLADRVY